VNIKIIAGTWAKNYNIPGELALKDGAGVADALAELAVSVPIKITEIGMTSLNGKAVPRTSELNDGDRLEIFPVIVDG
jgi:sulfur carrier protein ThiS